MSEPRINEYWFCGDNSNGSLHVMCMLCKHKFDTKSTLPNHKEKCPHCGEILD